ncbi:MAG: hypothetical protein J7K00_01625 [Candidatus Diapherotrites archaeon]|nr:hypothetical protein [Candidatus Diapherotrites archaeon]
MFDLFKSSEEKPLHSLPKNKEKQLSKASSLEEKADGIEKSLESDLMKFKGIVKSLEKELDTRSSRINFLESKISRMVEKKEFNSALAKLKALKGELDSTSASLASKEEKFKKQVAMLNKAVSVLKTEKVESEVSLKQDLKDSGSKVKKFSSELEDLKLEFDELQDNFMKTSEKNRELKEKLDELSSLVSVKEKETSDFKKQKEREFNQAKNALRSSFEESFSKKEGLLVEKLGNERKQLEREMEAKKSRVDSLLLSEKKRVSELKAELSRVVSEKDGEISAILEEKDNLEKEISAGLNEKNRKKIEGLNSKIDEFAGLKSGLESKVSELNKQLKFAGDSLEKQKRAITSHYESELHLVNRQLAKLSSDFNAADEKSAELEEFNNSLKQQVRESASALNDAKSHMAKVEKEAAEKIALIEKSSKSELLKTKKALETENKRLVFRNHDVEKQLVELASKNSVLISELQRKNDNLQSRLSSMASEDFALKKQLSDLHSRFSEEKNESMVFHREFDSSTRQLHGEIENFRAKCTGLNKKLAAEKESFRQKEAKIRQEVRSIVESEFASKINALEKQKTRLLNGNSNIAEKLTESENNLLKSKLKIKETKVLLGETAKENDSLRNLLDEKDATIGRIEKQIEMIENHLNQL